mgnify:CR=1 FL=1
MWFARGIFFFQCILSRHTEESRELNLKNQYEEPTTGLNIETDALPEEKVNEDKMPIKGFKALLLNIKDSCLMSSRLTSVFYQLRIW